MMELEVSLLRAFVRNHPLEAAQALEAIPAQEAAAVLADEPAEAVAAVVARLIPPSAFDAVGAMGAESASGLLCRLPAEIAASILNAQSLPVQSACLKAIPQPWNATISRTMRARPASVGAAMDRRPVALADDFTVERALDYLRSRALEADASIFVVDRQWRLLGRTTVTQLFSAAQHRTLASVMLSRPTALSARALLDGLDLDPIWETADILPVTNDEGALVGSLSHLALRVRFGRRASEPVRPRAPMLWSGLEMALTGYRVAVEAAAAVVGTRVFRERRPER